MSLGKNKCVKAVCSSLCHFYLSKSSAGLLVWAGGGHFSPQNWVTVQLFRKICIKWIILSADFCVPPLCLQFIPADKTAYVASLYPLLVEKRSVWVSLSCKQNNFSYISSVMCCRWYRFDSWSYETLQMPQWSVGILWRIETCFLLSLCSKCKQGTLGVVSKQIYIFVHFKYWFCRQHCFNGANLWSWVHANLP